MNTNQSHITDDALNADYLHSAYLIDEEGNEVRITRSMILDSCNQLTSDEAFLPPLSINS